MAFKQKPNTGALFKNTRADKENSPAYRGDLNVDGTDYWIAAWLKEAKDGKKYMSLAVTPKDADRDVKQHESRREPAEDIPF